MIQLIAGQKGKGKTKSLIKMANEAAKTSKGHVVYIDDDKRHIYDLNHHIRFIQASEFPIDNLDEFFGFVCGILSEDFDIDHIFIDGLLKVAHISEDMGAVLIHKLKELSEKFNIKFVISLSCKTEILPENLKEYLVAVA
ncbi:twitching motility protein PilT [Vallitalea okinawensis]|uniref:twitching motility protein PilT n=1 Tax=Vallitalea okinawensis TaxID=2078660 RepID=UPI000CFC0D3C|nr:twitching motility protein PilT [Vallitalea okinawensis]